MSPDQREFGPGNYSYKLFDRSEDGSLDFKQASYFKTKGVPVGDLGVASLDGQKMVGIVDETGVYQKDGIIHLGISEDLESWEYFRLGVNLEGAPNIPIVCKINLPDGETLIGNLNYNEAPAESGPLEKSRALGFSWLMASGDYHFECWFYDIGDPDYLSSLEFEFFTTGSVLPSSL